MKRLAIVAALLCLTFATEAKPKAEIKSQWRGARVAYLGDSITDKRQVEKGQNDTYWVYLESILGITPYVYGISGRQWSDIPRQTDILIAEHGDEVDAIMIFIGTNDFNVKLKSAIKFLEDGDRVKVTVRFRGREMTHTEIGEELLINFGEGCAEVANMDKKPKLEGRHMSIFLSPKSAK